jgi:hypothetical protein
LKTIVLKLLNFRIKQIFRFIKQTGYIRFIFLASILTILLSQGVANLTDFHPIYSILLYLLGIIFIHIFRNDTLFISHLDLDRRFIYISEYNFIIIPLTLIILSVGSINLIPAGHIVSTAVAFLPSRRFQFHNATKAKQLHWVPAHLFEWRTTFRKYYWNTLIIYGMAILFSNYIYSLPVFILIWFTVLVQTFNHSETKELIEVYAEKKEFIKQKLKNHTLFLHALILPHYSLFLIFHSSDWILMLFIICILQSILTFSILFKYSVYRYNRHIIGNQIPAAIFLILSLIMFPISLILLYVYWKNSLVRIQA